MPATSFVDVSPNRFEHAQRGRTQFISLLDKLVFKLAGLDKAESAKNPLKAKGTPRFPAPEVESGNLKRVTSEETKKKLDIYSLGKTSRDIFSITKDNNVL